MIWMLASLMMTQAEEQQVAPFVDAANEHHEQQTSASLSATLNDDIRISAIIYTTPDQWVVWMCGNKLRPQNLDGDGFKLQKVEPTGVTLTLGDHPGKTFHLSPGESLNRSTGQVVD